jgi:hypothetical protein
MVRICRCRGKILHAYLYVYKTTLLMEILVIQPHASFVWIENDIVIENLVLITH